jgi:hypothetical protein
MHEIRIGLTSVTPNVESGLRKAAELREWR